MELLIQRVMIYQNLFSKIYDFHLALDKNIADILLRQENDIFQYFFL